MQNLDFYITLYPLKKGAWNFRLSTDDATLKSGYHSPLASYESPSRAVYFALQEAQKIAHRFKRKPAKVTVLSEDERAFLPKGSWKNAGQN